jgi:hypothetical protein
MQTCKQTSLKPYFNRPSLTEIVFGGQSLEIPMLAKQILTIIALAIALGHFRAVAEPTIEVMDLSDSSDKQYLALSYDQYKDMAADDSTSVKLLRATRICKASGFDRLNRDAAGNPKFATLWTSPDWTKTYVAINGSFVNAQTAREQSLEKGFPGISWTKGAGHLLAAVTVVGGVADIAWMTAHGSQAEVYSYIECVKN